MHRFASICAATLSLYSSQAAPPSVTNVRAWQAQGTKKVNIYYDLTADIPAVSVSVLISSDGGTTWSVPAQTLSGDGYPNSVTPGMGKWIVWNAGVDWNGQVSKNVRFRVTANDGSAPAGFSLIPAGSFQMGNAMAADTDITDAPVHTVTVSAFYMAQNLVTWADWNTVRTWGLANGYTDLNVGLGKAANHPVNVISWDDAVKWCDARSEMEGFTPCYTLDGAVYRTGMSYPMQTIVVCNWSANGYRLPTEAEWEKAARGGMSGQRFPWGNTISESQANYYGDTSDYSYDLGPDGFNSIGSIGLGPDTRFPPNGYTSPVGSFPPNGYGLYDMAGNVCEWCWDSRLYAEVTHTDPDPRGPTLGAFRMFRGGGWFSPASWCCVAFRSSQVAWRREYAFGFRVARSSVP